MPDGAAIFPRASDCAGTFPSTNILGVPVTLLNLERACEIIAEWAARGQSNYVCVRDVHGVVLAAEDREFRLAHENAGMVTPDGMPLVWISRRRGHRGVSRVAGADLVEAVCASPLAAGMRHYFYGGKPGVAERMAAALQSRHPGMIVCGVSWPPFGPLSEKEDRAATEAIVRAQPHVVWVGLSTPRQEYWMRDHVGRIPGATLIGVGAAFDYHAGTVKRAPKWVQRAGLEWLHRLCAEPKRLWRRYLIRAPQFVFMLAWTTLLSRRRRDLHPRRRGSRNSGSRLKQIATGQFRDEVAKAARRRRA
jgi:N-acetylglucosaminyldiphosphoundecaprenol N-acetyl-beta-D-mannosaminyltransferase